MPIVTVHEAKTNLSKLIKRASAGEEIIIARGDKPVAKLVSIGNSKEEREPGMLKGKFQVGPELFEPLPPEELDAWE
jgi:prevent-host-death family protein